MKLRLPKLNIKHLVAGAAISGIAAMSVLVGGGSLMAPDGRAPDGRAPDYESIPAVAGRATSHENIPALAGRATGHQTIPIDPTSIVGAMDVSW